MFIVVFLIKICNVTSPPHFILFSILIIIYNIRAVISTYIYFGIFTCLSIYLSICVTVLLRSLWHKTISMERFQRGSISLEWAARNDCETLLHGVGTYHFFITFFLTHSLFHSLSLSLYIYIYIYMVGGKNLVVGPKRERNILKWIDPRRDLYFLNIYLLISFVHACMFPAYCFLQRRNMAQGLVNGVLNETWTH